MKNKSELIDDLRIISDTFRSQGNLSGPDFMSQEEQPEGLLKYLTDIADCENDEEAEPCIQAASDYIMSNPHWLDELPDYGDLSYRAFFLKYMIPYRDATLYKNDVFLAVVWLCLRDLLTGDLKARSKAIYIVKDLFDVLNEHIDGYLEAVIEQIEQHDLRINGESEPAPDCFELRLIIKLANFRLQKDRNDVKPNPFFDEEELSEFLEKFWDGDLPEFSELKPHLRRILTATELLLFK